jgi:hypothetical protein
VKPGASSFLPTPPAGKDRRGGRAILRRAPRTFGLGEARAVMRKTLAQILFDIPSLLLCGSAKRKNNHISDLSTRCRQSWHRAVTSSACLLLWIKTLREEMAMAWDLPLQRTRRSKLRQTKAVASYRSPGARLWSAQACLRLVLRQLAAAPAKWRNLGFRHYSARERSDYMIINTLLCLLLALLTLNSALVPASVPLLLSTSRVAVDATSDLVINETLPIGFRLSGRITGAADASSVMARSVDGKIYRGGVDSAIKRYLNVVPAGTYNLSVCHTVSQGRWGQVNKIFTDPNPVQISSDTAHDITLPSVSLTSISGTVSGLANPAASDNGYIAFTSADNQLSGHFRIVANGMYQGELPAGQYTVSLSILFPDTGFSTLYGIGRITVAGTAVTANFSVPDTAKLSGSFRPAGGVTTPFTEMRAIDVTAPEPGCVGPEMWATQIQPDPSGYQTRLLTGRAHRLLGQFSLMDQQNPMIPIGRVTVPSAGQSVTLINDAIVDLNVPPLPPRVTISGRVVDGSGNGVRVGVVAVAEGVAGAPNVMFRAEARTASDGSYRLTVLSGSNYEISFLPPAPFP